MRSLGLPVAAEIVRHKARIVFLYLKRVVFEFNLEFCLAKMHLKLSRGRKKANTYTEKKKKPKQNKIIHIEDLEVI